MIEAIIFDWVGTLYQFGGKGLFPYSERVLRELHPRYKLAVIVDADKSPEQFIECMRRLNVRPENTLVVDDRIVRGIQIGNALGCKTALVRNGKYANKIPTKKKGKPTYKIKSVEDLLTIL